METRLGPERRSCLAKMFDAIQAKQQSSAIRGRDLTAQIEQPIALKTRLRSLEYGSLGEAGFGHAVSKILNRSDLCDDLCVNAILWLAVIQGMMTTYFPGEPGPDAVRKDNLQCASL